MSKDDKIYINDVEDDNNNSYLTYILKMDTDIFKIPFSCIDAISGIKYIYIKKDSNIFYFESKEYTRDKRDKKLNEILK